MIQKIAKTTIHILTGNRRFYYKQLERIAKQSGKKTVLEIGSGPKIKGREPYSAKHIFTDCKQFVQSDINKDYGHNYIDIVTMSINQKYDIILCLNVLEHVYDFEVAIKNLRRALKPKGTLCVAVPFTFPLHDEPGDYWRFTEHALRKMFKDFSKVQIKHQRSRRFPAGYFVEAVR